MNKFNKGNRFGGGGFGGFGGDRGPGRSQMHQAVCDDCGQGCEVPFKPMHGKPVFCHNCFKRDSGREGDFAPHRAERRDFGKPERRDFGRPAFRDKQMHAAICADCGNECEVPFRPTGEKPVYCSNCFGKGGPMAGGKKSEVSEEKFEQLNKKLDKVIRILEIMQPKKTFIIEKPQAAPQEAEKIPVMKENQPEKAAKKPVGKKIPAKKTPKASKPKK